MSPGVSVCLPVLNGSDSIRRAIESVLLQSYKEVELLVWDDGSTDGTYEIANGYPIRVFRAANTGVAKARNEMLKEAKYDLVAMIDHDDYWYPGKLEQQVNCLKSDSVVLTHANCTFIYPQNAEGTEMIMEKREVGKMPSEDPFAHILPDNRLITSSVLFRKKPLLDAGGFQPLARCSDWLGWFELARAGRFIYDPDVKVGYTVRENSLANAGLKFHAMQYKVLDEHVLGRQGYFFGALSPSQQKHYTDLARRSSGVALSSMSSCERKAGNREEAKRLARLSLKRAPGVLRVWTRALRAI